MNKTPAPKPWSADRAGGAFKQDHAAEVTNDEGISGFHKNRRESMGTAQGEGAVPLSPNAPYLNQGGVITPLMPIAVIDSESEAGSWRAALPFCQQITQSDYPEKI